MSWLVLEEVYKKWKKGLGPKKGLPDCFLMDCNIGQKVREADYIRNDYVRTNDDDLWIVCDFIYHSQKGWNPYGKEHVI